MPKGIYEKTEEHKKKISASLKIAMSRPEVKEKIREAMNCSEAKEKRLIGLRTIEAKKKMSSFQKKRIRGPRSEETKKKLSIINIKRIQNGWNINNQYKTGYYDSKNNGKVWHRSSWELAYMRYLDSINESWEYEKHYFDLGSYHYMPDFYLPRLDEFHEIKGRGSLEKVEKFRKLYPDKKIIVLQGKELQDLELI